MLLIHLEKWDINKKYERLGIEELKRTIFDVEIPEYRIPVEPGRNLAILIEVAALQQRLIYQGYNPAKEFNKNLIDRIRQKKINPDKNADENSNNNLKDFKT